MCSAPRDLAGTYRPRRKLHKLCQCRSIQVRQALEDDAAPSDLPSSRTARSPESLRHRGTRVAASEVMQGGGAVAGRIVGAVGRGVTRLCRARDALTSSGG